MAITALPQSTVHLLGSAQALTTPTSLVKELIDNSIDARATSIEVLISPNTLDKIEVRDNGHGIVQEDLDALGRRGHTSKLRVFEDLKSVGGISLGFRGEALASAVQMGEVSITTRTDGEQVASLVKLKAQGGIGSQVRTSHPVGTTVTVTKFMYNLPVRKLKFEKAAPKTLGEIKKLLQGYSLARPHIKLALKVTKGGKGSWSFAPRPNDAMKEIVSKVLSRDLAAQCVEKSLTFIEDDSSSNEASSVVIPKNRLGSYDPKGLFVIEAFLPKLDADVSKIGYGQFISIDSRPVAHDKGTMRKIVSAFKHYVKGSLSASSETLKSPFLRVNIKCPASSYDPNIEPAKDDVLFQDEALVLESIENLFKALYGDRKATSPEPTVEGDAEDAQNSFSLLLARKPPINGPIVSEVATIKEGDFVPHNPIEVAREVTPAPSDIMLLTPEEHVGVDDDRSGNTRSKDARRKWGFDMSKDYAKEEEGASMRKQRIGGWGPSVSSAVASTKSNDGLNPWLIAKMNTPVRENSNELSVQRPGEAPMFGEIYLPTPKHSSSPTTQLLERGALLQEPRRSRKTFRNEDIQAISMPASRGRVQQHLTVNIAERSDQSVSETDDGLLVGDDSETYTRRTGFISARHAPEPDDPLPIVAPKPRKSRGANTTFVPPSKKVETSTSSGDFQQTTITGDYAPETISRPTASVQEPDEELAWAMDYENRKDNVIRRRRLELRAQRSAAALETEVLDTPSTQSSPHKNRYNAAIATLESGALDTIKENITPGPAQKRFKTSLPESDPRAYLMRRQKSMAAQASKPGGSGKLTRAKSTRLPFETISDEAQLHNLLIRFPAGMPHIRRLATALAEEDPYINRGTTHSPGLVMTPLETTLVASKVEDVVKKWMETNVDEEKDVEMEVQFNFENLLNNNDTSR